MPVKGEVLFLGASGAKRGFEDWEITYRFAASPNVAGLSYMDDQGYRALGAGGFPSKTSISIGWSREWDKLRVLRRFTFAPHVNPSDGKMPVELIGPVDAPGGNGPSNGMYALQKALRKRIAEGLDWLSIKSLPSLRSLKRAQPVARYTASGHSRMLSASR